MRGFLVFPGVIALVVGLNAPLQAQEAGEDPEEREPRHHPAVFLGATTSEHETNPSLGLEYEYRISERWGMGVLLEFTFESTERELIVGIPIKYHMGPLALLVVVGVERSREKDDGEGETEDSSSDSLGRVGAEYGFEVGRFELAPTANLDFSDASTKLVWGLVTSLGF